MCGARKSKSLFSLYIYMYIYVCIDIHTYINFYMSIFSNIVMHSIHYQK